MQRMDFLMQSVLDDLQSLLHSPSQVHSKSNGFLTLIENIPEIQSDDVAILEVSSQDDKTASVISLALSSSETLRVPVLIFSSVASALQMAYQFVSAVGRIDHSRLCTGTLLDSEWPRLTHTIERLRHLPIHIKCGTAVSLPVLDANARRLEKSVGQIGLLIVDIECLYEWKSFFRQKQLFSTCGRIDFIKQLAQKRKCRIALYSRPRKESNYDQHALNWI